VIAVVLEPGQLGETVPIGKGGEHVLIGFFLIAVIVDDAGSVKIFQNRIERAAILGVSDAATIIAFSSEVSNGWEW
jgi:hypothetical protein